MPQQFGARKPQHEQHQTQIRREFTRQADTLSAAAIFTDEHILARIRQAAGLTRQARLLDVACGPGIVAAALAPEAGDVVAVDLTPTMVSRARQRCRQAGHTNVHCILGQAEVLPFANATFDVVVNRLALHHFPRPAVTLAELARVTRESGRLVIVDVVSSEVPEESSLHNALEVLRDPSHVRMLPQSELLSLLHEVGLSVQSCVAWTNRRGFDEWLQITNAPERIAPLQAVMVALAKAGVQAGINLHLEGNTVVFEHHSLLIMATKRPTE
ncbi:putative methyltransferase YcgJ [Candidatus Entotheonellaceae bacterium PAL068K]